MGMCLGLYTLSDDSIRKILADPPLIWKVVAPDDPDAYETARREAAGTFLQKLFGKKSPPSEATTLQLGEGECSHTDLDKAWHGIHYLLTSRRAKATRRWTSLLQAARKWATSKSVSLRRECFARTQFATFMQHSRVSMNLY
jgi:hypothetical protein